MNALPSHPCITIAYRYEAYDETELQGIIDALAEGADVEVEPLYLALMGGTSELRVSIAFGEPILDGDTVSRPVHDALVPTCRKLADWWRERDQERDGPPELVALRIAGRDVIVDLSCDSSPEAFLKRDEIRTAPAALREMAPRLSALLTRYPSSVVSVGVHADPECAAGARCVVGRFWEVGADGSDPTLLLDSWRKRAYVRATVDHFA